MRIVGGVLKGRLLTAPPGRDVRPTSDRARESLFNRLVHGGYGPGGVSPLPDARVLDVFCGTGALGLEALSRGAASALFMDNDRVALGCARANADALGVADQCRFQQADATKPPPSPTLPTAAGSVGSVIGGSGTGATLVFMDPPYRSEAAALALAALADSGWICDGALICLEVSADVPADGGGATTFFPDRFALLDSRRTGAAQIMLLRFADGAGALET